MQCVCVHVLFMDVTVGLHYSIVIITKRCLYPWLLSVCDTKLPHVEHVFSVFVFHSQNTCLPMQLL